MKKIIALIMVVLMLCAVVIPASAAEDSFVESINEKVTPIVVPQKDEDGNDVGGIIFDENGNQIYGVPSSSIMITPISGKEDASQDVKDALEKAFDSIKEADNIGALTDDVADYLNKNMPGVNAKDLLVSQLLDIRVSDDYSQYLKDGNYMHIILDIDEAFMFIMQYVNDSWSIVKNFVIKDGKVEFDVIAGAQIALIKSNINSKVEDEKKKSEDGTIQHVSPQTGDTQSVALISVGVLFALAAASLFVIASKKHSA